MPKQALLPSLPAPGPADWRLGLLLKHVCVPQWLSGVCQTLLTTWAKPTSLLAVV